MRKHIERGIEWLKEKSRGGIPPILEDETDKEHLNREEKIREIVFGNTDPESFPLMRRRIIEVCEEIQKSKQNSEQNEEIILIIDVGCSWGDATIRLVKELKKRGIKFHIFAIEQISGRVLKAKLKYFLSKERYCTTFHHRAMSEGVKTRKGEFIKADIIRVADISPNGMEIWLLDEWAENNLKDGGYLFYANSDVSSEVKVFQWKKDEETGKNFLKLLEKFEDESYSWRAPRE